MPTREVACHESKGRDAGSVDAKDHVAFIAAAQTRQWDRG